MADLNQFVALRLVLPGWPTNILTIPPQIDCVGLADFEATSSGSSSLMATGTLQIIDDITMDLPLIPGLSLALFNNSDFTEFDFELEYLTDSFSVSLKSLSVSLRIQTDLLKRMEKVGDGFVEVPADPLTGEPQPVEIMLEGADLSVNSNGEFTFIAADETLALTLLPFMIAESGVIVDVQSLHLILSAATAESLPETIDPTWRGVYLEQATIHLSEGLNNILPDDVTLQDFFIGSGGFCGRVAGNWEADRDNPFDEKSGDIFGFRFRTTNVEIEFKQNAIVAGSIAGYLQVPFFEKELEVEVGLTNDGGFTIAITADDGLFTLRKENIISIEISSLEFVEEDGEFLFKLSGKVTPELPGLDWPSFELKSLSIGSDGRVKVAGGWIELPEQASLDFYGFKVEISELGFGSDEVDHIDYNWIGFSGGIQIVQGLPLRGGVEGLKVMWDQDGTSKLKIGGVYLQFEIPDVLSFDGSAYFIDEEVNGIRIKEFRGGLDVFLIPLNFGLNGQFITGKTNDYTYFYIFLDVQLPVGVPLGPPVLGLYGLAGLYGYNMTVDYNRLTTYDGEENRPDLTDAEASWFNQENAMAFGAGLTVGTLPDVKFLAKVKAVFAVLVPGPVLLIEGYAGTLSLGENYPFRVLAVIDPSSGTFLMNISAEYQFTKNSADLLLMTASAEAFFSAADPDAWHFYLGQDDPESKRIRADILNFFTATSYLMVDSDGLKMGAWIGYSLNEKYGILKVTLEAWISGSLELSPMPFQAKGSLTLYGNAELSAGPVSLGISVEANATAEAPKPLLIAASLTVQLKTPLGKPKATIKLKWEKEGVPPYALPLSTTLGIEHRKATKNWDVLKPQRYVLDADKLWTGNENSSAAIDTVPLVPPDVYLVLNFDKPVEDLGLVGDNPAPKPANEKVGDYEFKYALKSVVLQYRDSWNETSDDGNWQDYETFAEDQVEEGDDSYKLTGTWQILPSTDGAVNTKLVLNATTPFEISRLLQESDYWFALLDAYNPDYPCAPAPEEAWTCVDFDERATGKEYPLFVEDGFTFISEYPMDIFPYPAGWLGTEKALNSAGSFETLECLNIKLQEPSGEIKLRVVKNAILAAGVGNDASIKFTSEFSKLNEVELYVDNQNASTLAFIHFPEAAFAGIPQKVYITCVPATAHGEGFTAYDKDLNVLDTVKFKNGEVGEVHTYELHSGDEPIRSIAIQVSTVRILEICYAVPHNTDYTNILVVTPEDMVKSQIHFSKNSSGTIYVYDQDQREIEQFVFDIPWDTPDDQMQPVEILVSDGSFRSFFISGVCSICRICGVTVEAEEAFQNDSRISDHIQTRLEENWGQHTAKLLHPNKYYRLQVQTSTSRRKDSGDWTEEVFTEDMYFKTGNPPGRPSDLQLSADESQRYDLQEPLKDLSAYIAYTVPDGAAANEPQPRVYRSYDIGVVYNDSYIDQMYQMAGLPIRIRLLDNNNLPVLASDGTELELSNTWGDNPELSQTREETQYRDVLDASGCHVMAVEVVSESNQEVFAASRDLLLLPQIQYRAQVVAGESAPLYEFGFLTSRYATFLHHMHSFADIVWDHFALLNDPEFVIDATVLTQILSNAESEAVKFEQLMTLFDLNPRTLPEKVEVSLIDDKNGSFGLLVESPEPLDWDRLQTSLLFAEKNNPVEEFDGKIKVVDASIKKADTDPNAQWVDLLILETTNLSGYMLEYLAVSAAATDAYREFFVFPDEIYLAGTLLRVYNGPDFGVSPDDVEHIQFYANRSSQTFEPAGTFLRLKTADGEAICTRCIYRKQTFTELDANIVLNTDGTRLFVFVRDGSQKITDLREGIYRLQFTFQRDIGPDQPALQRYGFSAPEETYLEFSLPALMPDKS